MSSVNLDKTKRKAVLERAALRNVTLNESDGESLIHEPRPSVTVSACLAGLASKTTLDLHAKT